MFEISAVLLTLAALFAYLNYRFIRLPATIGIMVQAMVLSLLLLLVMHLGDWPQPLLHGVRYLLRQINFEQAVFHGMLAFLLFAAALHTDLRDLRSQWITVMLLATVGVMVSTFMIGAMVYGALSVLGLQIDYIYCLLFGALISPTDPIAVFGILRSVHTPRQLEIIITGESLLNDGISVVLFLVLLQIARRIEPVSAKEVALLLGREILGGAMLGLVAGTLYYRLIKHIDRYPVEVLMTLSLATGSYALADSLGFSGPIAVVLAGLVIGNLGRSQAMSDQTRANLDTFWELVDDALNAVLFLLIGLGMLMMSFTRWHLLAGVAALPIVLLARLLTVGPIITVLGRWKQFSPGTILLLTWSGMRGGISVALALAIPVDLKRERPILVVMTYAVAIFSILVQGLTIGPLVKRLIKRREDHAKVEQVQ